MAGFQLAVIEGRSREKEFSFTKELVKLGHDPKNDLIMNDCLVSPFHAEICLDKDHYRIIDLGNTYPALVNGSEAEGSYLSDGDEITIGKSKFRFSGKTEAGGKAKKLNLPPARQLILIGLILLCLIYLLIPSGKKDEEQPGEEKVPTVTRRTEKPPETTLKEAELQEYSQLTREERLNEALKSYELGKKKQEDWRISLGNLHASIKLFEKSLYLMDNLETRPEIYQDTRDRLAEAQDKLEEIFKEHRFTVEKYLRFKQWEQARSELITIQELIPDRSDPRAVYARDKLEQVEKARRKAWK
ncbi:MAG: FHA domain-containing protein [Deltaproteobacteria bacterium]|nr:MAG: FHA domain-containing protein [Deltaproteobacteria bacterium]